jgi:hypothetical protein
MKTEGKNENKKYEEELKTTRERRRRVVSMI